MCGRFTLRLAPAELTEIFRLMREPMVVPRYNIAPTQPVAVLRRENSGFDLSMMRWGLIPSWAKDEKIGSRMINARGETVAEKPSFRAAFKRRRCLIPTDGFYEWQKRGDQPKQPFLIGMKNGEPFAFAGLWETWEDPKGKAVESCTIITTETNALLKPLHDRMPVIIHEDDYDRWTDLKTTDAAELQSLLVPFPPEEMQAFPVSTLVNSPRNDVAGCVEPVGDGSAGGALFD